MLTLSDLDRMSRAETIIIEPSHETNCSPEQFRELVESARAWALAEAEARRRYRFGDDPVRWLWDRGRVSYTLSSNAGYTTLQGAVIAALEQKGE